MPRHITLTLFAGAALLALALGHTASRAARHTAQRTASATSESPRTADRSGYIVASS